MTKHVQRPLGWALIGILLMGGSWLAIQVTNDFQVDQIGNLIAWIGVLLIAVGGTVTAWRMIRS